MRAGGMAAALALSVSAAAAAQDLPRFIGSASALAGWVGPITQCNDCPPEDPLHTLLAAHFEGGAHYPGALAFVLAADFWAAMLATQNGRAIGLGALGGGVRLADKLTIGAGGVRSLYGHRVDGGSITSPMAFAHLGVPIWGPVGVHLQLALFDSGRALWPLGCVGIGWSR